MPVKPEERTIQSADELHVGLDIPRHTARQIYLWAKDQEWPFGTELEIPDEYHVTLLYTPSGHSEHKDGWWIDHLEESEVSIKGVTAFGAQEKGFAYVLLLDAPEIREHAENMQGRAEALGLEITHFPGGYKPHITVGYGPTRLTTKPPVPHFQFHVGPSHVSDPRPEESEHTSAAEKQIIPHINEWTGLVCHCGWGSPKPRRGRQTRTAGLEGNRLRKAPDKAWRTPQGDAFRQHLTQLPEEYDPILPYLANRYKKGDVRLMGEPGAGELRHLTGTQPPRIPFPNPGNGYPEGPSAPRWATLHDTGGMGTYPLDNWLQWYNARQHPTRRGVDVMNSDFTPQRMSEQVNLHQQALEQEKARERWLAQYGPGSYGSDPAHVFGPEMYEGFDNPESEEAKQFARKHWGWQVVPLDEFQAEGDTAALGHCIGRDDQPYKRNIGLGNIQAFSLRDADGYPHASWHVNPSGDSIGHMQGKSGYPNPEQRQLISTFNRAKGYPDEESEREEELEPEYDTSFEFPRATDMVDYTTYHHPDHMYDYMYSQDINPHPDYGIEDMDHQTPRWDSIANDYLNSGGGGDDFHQTLKHEDTWAPMANALRDEANQDDETHREALDAWNSEAPHQHQVEVSHPANEVDQYNEVAGNGAWPQPDDWDGLARDYLGHYEYYAKPGWQGHTEYGYFHSHLPEHDDGQNDHAELMRRALMSNIDWEDPEHQWAAQTWNSGMPGHNVYPPEPQSQPEVSPHQEGFQWSPLRQNWEDPTLGIEDRLRQYQQRGTFSRVAYNPDEVQILDHLSMKSVAAQLHYRFEQTGSLNPQQAVDYAHRVLGLLGYPTDEITTQAALQAWQTEYPEDKVVTHPDISQVPEKFVPHPGELSQSLGQPLVDSPDHGEESRMADVRKVPNVPDVEEYDDDRDSTVPTQVNDPDDHWPEFGDLPPDRKRDIQFSNDWAWHKGGLMPVSPKSWIRDQLIKKFGPESIDPQACSEAMNQYIQEYVAELQTQEQGAKLAAMTPEEEERAWQHLPYDPSEGLPNIDRCDYCGAVGPMPEGPHKPSCPVPGQLAQTDELMQFFLPEHMEGGQNIADAVTPTYVPKQWRRDSLEELYDRPSGLGPNDPRNSKTDEPRK